MQHFTSRTNLQLLDPNSRMLPHRSKKRQPVRDYRPKNSFLSPGSPRAMDLEIQAPCPGSSANEARVYLPEIQNYLLRLETQSGSRADGFLRWQSEVTAEMRAVLVDWLVEVHLKFKLSGESLFLAVNLLDRFLSVEQVKRDRLQLVGICALLIAAKIEDVFAPQIKDLVYLSDYSCTKDQILECQGVILAALAFDFSYSSPLHCLAVLVQEDGLDGRFASFARYMLELSLLSSSMSQFPSTCQAQAAVYIAGRVFKLRRKLPQPVGRERECIERMFSLGLSEKESRLQGVRRKFGLAQFHGVSELQMQIGD